MAPPPPRAAAAQADPARPPAASSPPPRTTRPSTASAPPPRAPAPPSAASVPPAPASTPPPEADRYADLDTESVIALLKSLSRRVDGARSDDPLLRELHDELQTLRRTLYSSNTKPAWIGASLKTIHGLLEEATRHSVGEEIRAAEHLTHARSILRD
ncbi:MAG: hypothetical protein M5U08_13285 [Burkholderiales bacterium]|nr:hypothetical protein [Burkholderiales bacterium]